jgi:hypothetical protein
MTYADASEYDERRLHSRDFDLLMGIARRLADKPQLDESDVEFLDRWLSENPRALMHPVFRPILEFIEESDWHHLTSRPGLAALHGLLRKLSGDTNNDGKPDGPTAIGYTEPVPVITFPGMRFCFTGTFRYGGRKVCEQAVISRGATVGNIAKTTDYLVVGSRITDAWKHSTFGLKITQAMAWEVDIVKEDDWIAALKGKAEPKDRGPKCAARRAPEAAGKASETQPGGPDRPPPSSSGRPSDNVGAWSWWLMHWKSIGFVIVVSSIVGWSLA